MSNYAKTNQLEEDQSIIKNQISTGIKTLSKMQETLKAHREKMKEVEGRVDKQSDTETDYDVRTTTYYDVCTYFGVCTKR